MRSLNWRGLWLAVGFAIAALVVYVCLRPGGLAAPWIPRSDKLNHALAYLALASWFGALLERQYWKWLVVGLLLFGGGIELAQEAMPFGRRAEWGDMLANLVGIVGGLICAQGFGAQWLGRLDQALGARAP